MCESNVAFHFEFRGFLVTFCAHLFVRKVFISVFLHSHLIIHSSFSSKSSSHTDSKIRVTFLGVSNYPKSKVFQLTYSAQWVLSSKSEQSDIKLSGLEKVRWLDSSNYFVKGKIRNYFLFTMLSAVSWVVSDFECNVMKLNSINRELASLLFWHSHYLLLG